MALRPPCEEPSSPLHPGSQDFVILAFAWVPTSCLIGDGQSPLVILGKPPVNMHRSALRICCFTMVYESPCVLYRTIFPKGTFFSKFPNLDGRTNAQIPMTCHNHGTEF